MSELTADQIAEYQDVFNVFDKDGNGFISEEELVELIGKLNGVKPSVEHAKKMIAKFDTDGDGEIDFGEFCEIMKSTENIDNEIDAAFKAIDKDGSGTLDIDEVGQLFEKLGQPQTPEDLKGLFEYIDTDGNGEIDEYEFKSMYERLNIKGAGLQADSKKGPGASDSAAGAAQAGCCIIL